MHNIFELSKYILVPILTEWLHLETFLNFDCAVSGRKRTALHELVESHPRAFTSIAVATTLPLTWEVFDCLGSLKLEASCLSSVRITPGALKSWYDKSEDEFQGKLSQFADKIHSASISDVTEPELFSDCCQFIRSFLHLSSLSIDHCHGTSGLLAAVSSTSLEALSLSKCDAESSAVREVLESNPRIRDLNITDCSRLVLDELLPMVCLHDAVISDEKDGSSVLPSDMYHYESIVLMRNGPYRDSGSFEALTSLVRRSNALRRLAAYERGDQFMRELTWKPSVCRALTSLDISNSQHISEASFRELAACCPVLTDLNVSGCHSVDNDILRLFAEQLTDLRKIDLRDCVMLTEVGLNALFSICKTLEDVEFDQRRKVTKDFVGANCTSLKAFHVNLFLSVDAWPWDLSRNKQLGKLRVWANEKNYGDSDLNQLKAVSKRLTHLTLRGNLYDPKVRDILSNGVNLVEINLFRAMILRQQSVLAVVKSARALKTLYLPLDIKLDMSAADVIIASQSQTLRTLALFAEKTPTEVTVHLLLGLPRLTFAIVFADAMVDLQYIHADKISSHLVVSCDKERVPY